MILHVSRLSLTRTIIASRSVASDRFSCNVNIGKISILSLRELDLPVRRFCIQVVWESVHCVVDNAVGHANNAAGQLVHLLEYQH